ncbi:peroxiredoxin family protein [Thiogranum longum]|uniref:Peroxiredoxin family protein n=1 Tax=Thiogranum longum TaxID=1537524 RepID=A0A4R1HFD5_9GAMM|nr:DsrE/DsrF/DrsH-like family protein [Thiogranum longum]TCK19491.1 peroxiredoxin family protein [Thiogranum longum]
MATQIHTDTGMKPAVNTPGIHTFSSEDRISLLEQEVQELRRNTPDSNKVTLLMFSGDQDKALAGLTVATTAAAMGMDVTLFFTFWGINVLKQKRLYAGKNIKEKMIDLMTPAGANSMGVSKLNMLGAGAGMLKQMMHDKHVASAEELLELAIDNGVHVIACSMTLQVMGIKEDELIGGIDVAGAASYLAEASQSGCTLFI